MLSTDSTNCFCVLTVLSMKINPHVLETSFGPAPAPASQVYHVSGSTTLLERGRAGAGYRVISKLLKSLIVKFL